MRSIQNNFGRAVPPCDHVLRERVRGLFVAASKTKVTDLEVAVFVEQQVRGLQVPVDNVRGVDVEAPAQQLVHEVLNVVVGQVLPRVDHAMHVRLHQVRNNVNVLVASLAGWLRHINQRDDVLVVEEFQKFDLAHDSLGIDQIFECLGHLFDGHLRLRGVVVGRADHSVGAVTNLFDVLELVLHEEGRAYQSQP